LNGYSIELVCGTVAITTEQQSFYGNALAAAAMMSLPLRMLQLHKGRMQQQAHGQTVQHIWADQCMWTLASAVVQCNHLSAEATTWQ
jgi:hypothetical protein